ncbi:epidermal growth factor receptor substrate 15-like 1 [Pyrus ussuriensis x Pyrus communis]|uniref:Epidermal growth factor receptor substrate 15-like 1 n=1 Tax=Pyrus ussuriensis x Pyrus communis TaxID=2448454 RepID=A0A5N5HVR2_9ROSA|nr:epidermal growth factor receptor substrate 15-like 1 [Pyrus ussuriensis x Pyrus communis]
MAGPYADQLEAYFRRADLDGDGRISGAEAVAFFQGSNLPKPVLAQIWMHADQNKTGFLGRPEFYNALRLVTVAQSKRDLTPDIVKAALYGPAAAKIPAPQINLPPTSAPQSNPVAAASRPPMGMGTPPTSQNFGFRGPGVPHASSNQNYFPPQQNQSMRPPQAMPTGMPTGLNSRPPQQGVGGGMGPPNVPNANISNNWLGGSAGASPAGPRGVSPSMPSSTPNSQPPVSMPSLPTTGDSKALVVSGNGIASSSALSGDLFSATPSQPKQESSGSIYSARSIPTPSATLPVSSGPQSSSKLNALDSLSAFTMQPSGSQFQRPQGPSNPSQQVSAPASSSFPSSGSSVGAGNSTSGNSQIPWPKMKPSDIQKYTKVFMEVDTDRDGRITGEQARNLFLSWRLPREVLKQVWDLSDQDNDSMLSLREFCFSLYLMERYREGRPLPDTLPHNVMHDETLLSMTGQPKVAYGNAAWSPNPGFGQHQGMQGGQHQGMQGVAPAAGLRPPMQRSLPQADGALQPNQQNLRVRGMEGLNTTQHDNGKHDSANSKPEAPNAGKKVEETENVILDSREKMEFYRTKMQELVLYKSRCDNRLNEITERAIADKREAELLAKKYEEKYKQVAEIASKLTIEEATFREVQERKMELHQAIVKMEQGGSADGILQVRADRIQYDLEELVKALTERCKKHGLNMKSSAIIELPTGWQPGIQEGAAVWDEDWDKFEDEGFGNDLKIDASAKAQSASVQREHTSPDRSSTPDTSSFADGKSRNGEHAFGSESVFAHGEDEYGRSSNGSPAARNAPESPSGEFSDIHYGKSSEADAETHGSFDESTWGGAFDNNDDTDSVWGFNTKGSEAEKHKDFFGSDDFGLNPIRTGSPHAETSFQKKSLFFEDSVPSTPLSKFQNSPRYSEAGDYHFDNLSRFDSFSSNRHDVGFSSQPERFSRFDSINSTRDFGGHTRFDSISSSKDFGRFDSMSSSRDFGHGREPQLTRFDSIDSTKDFGQGAYSFDETDPFGSSGPFKVSSESQTSKKGSDNWSAF